MSLATIALVVALVAVAAATFAFVRLRLERRVFEAERVQLFALLAEREARAREQAAAAERERIHSDLHDDLGARLLGLIHAAPTPEYGDRARAALQDLRDVVTRSRGTPGTLGEVLGEIRAEASQRLAAVGIGLAWQERPDLPDAPLDHARALHLYRIAREAISNVIRHAQARRVRVRIGLSGDQLVLDLTDDGDGAPASPKEGSGLRGMRERAAELEGDIRWTPGTEGGTKVVLAVPIGGTP